MQAQPDSLSLVQGSPPPPYTAKQKLHKASAAPMSSPQDTEKQGWHTSAHQRLYLAWWTVASPIMDQGLLWDQSTLQLLGQKQLSLLIPPG